MKGAAAAPARGDKRARVHTALAFSAEYGITDLCDALASRLDGESALSLVIWVLAGTDPSVPVRESLTRLLELDNLALAARVYTAHLYAPHLASRSTNQHPSF